VQAVQVIRAEDDDAWEVLVYFEFVDIFEVDRERF